MNTTLQSVLPPAELVNVLADLRARYAPPALPDEHGNGFSLYGSDLALILDPPHSRVDRLVSGKWAATVRRVGRIVEAARQAIADAKRDLQPHALAKAIASIRARAWADVLAAIEELERRLLDVVEAFARVAVTPPIAGDTNAINLAVADDRAILLGLPLVPRLDALFKTIAAMNVDDEHRYAADIATRAVFRLGVLGTFAMLEDSPELLAHLKLFTRATRDADAFLDREAALLGLTATLHALVVAGEAIGDVVNELQAERAKRAERIAALKAN